MSIQASCDSCGRTYSVSEKYAGKRLPCKECGESFEVHGEDDDFDLPPSRPRRPASAGARRSAPPARAARKKSGKRRRKAGPNWMLIGIAGGGGLLVVGGLIWALMTLLGTTHDSLAKANLKAMHEMASILESVTDKASAEAAVPKLERLTDHIAELYRKERRLKETDPMTSEMEKEFKEKYEDQKKEAEERLNAQLKRLRDKPDVLAVLQEPMTGLSRKMDEVRKEERERKLEERGTDPKVLAARKAEADKAAEMQRKAMAEHQRQVAAIQEQMQNRDSNPPAGRPAGMGRPRVMPFDPRTGEANRDAMSPQGIVVKMSRVANFDDIQKRLKEIAGPANVFSTWTTPQGHSIIIDPIPDLQRFTEAVDFDHSAIADVESRTVMIEANPSYVFKPGGKVAVDDPEAAEDYAVTDTEVHKRWGDKTAIIRLKGLTSSSDYRYLKIRDLVIEARKGIGEGSTAFNSTGRKAGDNDIFLIFGPLANFDSLVKALDFGTVVKTFPEKRLVIFEPDFEKLFPKRTEVVVAKNVWPGPGPHGAKWFPAGEHFVEVALDEDSQELVVWLYDKNKQPATMGSRSMKVAFSRNIADTELFMNAVPLPTDPEGQSSRFVGSFGDLVFDAKRQNQGVRLHVFLGGKSHQIPL